jgi:hypothetical protein
MKYEINEGWAGVWSGDAMNACRTLVGNPLANHSVIWPRRMWKDNVNLYNSIAKGCEDAVWHIGLLAFWALSLFWN